MRIRLTMSKARDIMEANFRNQIKYGEGVLHLQGPPGIGKTAIIKDIAKKRGMKVYSYNFGQLPLEAVSGIPDIVENKETGIKETDWAIPHIMRFQDLPKEEGAILILDDWHKAPKNIKSLAYELFTDRSLQGYKLPEKTVVITLGNESKEAGIQKSESPVINRQTIISLEPDLELWKNWAKGEGQVHPSIIAFVEEYPQHAQEPESNKNPFGTLRSLTIAARELEFLEEIKREKGQTVSTTEVLALMQGHMTPEGASNFNNIYNVYTNFNTERVLIKGDPKGIKVENNLDITVAKNLLANKLYVLYYNYYSKLKSFTDLKEANKFKREETKKLREYTENLVKFIESEVGSKTHIIAIFSEINNVSKLLKEQVPEAKKTPFTDLFDIVTKDKISQNKYPKTQEAYRNITT